VASVCAASADESTLPEEVQQEVRQFFEEHENWLAEVIETGVTDEVNLQGCDTPRDVARVFLATIEGAILTLPDRSLEAYTETLQLLVDSIA
jgi:TetR/AcrR family transcriptional repressor of nem operon